MRILVLFAHPAATSFAGRLHEGIVEALRRGGHEVDDCDLYAEKFNPIMSAETYRNYLDMAANRAQARPYIDRLLASEALVLVSPVWHDGFPAILKGYFDCVFVPGVAFTMTNGGYAPALLNIKRVAAVCTFGATRARTITMGDPQRRFVKLSLGAQIGPGKRAGFIGLYNMDAASPEAKARYLGRVTRAFQRW
jgi:putative NADPH-quinone reductase